MRKFLALLVLGIAMLIATQAFAEVPLTYSPERIAWRTSTNTTGSANDISRGYMDSSTVTNTGTATTAASLADTTAPVILFQPPPRTTASAADTVSWFSIAFAPAPNSEITITADSIYVATQVSFDGKNWEPVTPTQLFYPANEMPTSAQTLSTFLLERGSSNVFYRQFTFQWAALGKIAGPSQQATTAPTELQLGVYRYVRFIVLGDWGGRYELYAWGPRTPPAELHSGN